VNGFDVNFTAPGDGAPGDGAPGFKPLWIQLRVGDAEQGDDTAPAHTGSNDQFSSLTEDAAGWQISLNNNAAGPGSMKSGCAWVFGIDPNFVDDGTWAMGIRITEVTPFPDSKGCWFVVGWAGQAGDLTDAGVISAGAGVLRFGTNNRAVAFDSSIRLIGGEAAHTSSYGIINRWNSDDQVIQASGRDGGGVMVSFTANYRNTGPHTGDRKIIVAAGCDNADDDGPHTGKFKLEYCVGQILPTNTF